MSGKGSPTIPEQRILILPHRSHTATIHARDARKTVRKLASRARWDRRRTQKGLDARKTTTKPASRVGRRNRSESWKALTICHSGVSERSAREECSKRRRPRVVHSTVSLSYYDEASLHVSIFRNVLDAKRLELPCEG